MIVTSYLLSLAVALAPAQVRSSEPSTPQARQTLYAFGACVADASTAKAAETLKMDFRTSAYRSSLLVLSNNNQRCSQRRRGFRAAGLLFAGSIAERLIMRDAAPLKARMARAAAAPATATFSPSDAVALCVVRAMPDEVSALLQTALASDAETQAVQSLSIGFARCAEGQPDMRVSPDGARAMLATAAYRQLAASAAQGS